MLSLILLVSFNRLATILELSDSLVLIDSIESKLLILDLLVLPSLIYRSSLLALASIIGNFGI